METETDVVRSLAALAHGLRLRVFRELVVAGPDGMTPGALVERLGVAGATLSFHLKELAHAGLVAPQRDGRRVVYRVAFDRMAALIGYLSANCCAGAPRARRRCAP